MITRMFLLGAAVSLVACAGNVVDRVDSVGTDPLNTAYRIEGQSVRLVDGRRERLAAPDSATKTITVVVGRPAYGDLDGAGGDDAVLLLKYDPGGSGTFYYLAAAVRVGERYQGTNAVLIGDRIVPRDIRIRNRMVVARYTDRLPDEPMGAYPTVAKTMALVVINGQLREIKPLVAGWVTIGHEVRAFQPCHSRDAHWLMGRSPALQEIMAAYRRIRSSARAFRPAFAVLAGNQVAPPLDGFGADYDTAFVATHLVRMEPEESCPRDVGRTSAPPPAEAKITFDRSRLDAAGLYGPSGGKRALSYAFCIPALVSHMTEVKQIDPTVAFFAASPGRIGCGTHEILCIGSTHQQDFRRVLRRLVELPYVERIDQSDLE